LVFRPESGVGMRPAHRMTENRLASFDSFVHGELPEPHGVSRNSALARSLLTQLFRRYPGSLAIRLWNGDKFSVGAAFPPSSTEAPFVLVFRHP
jgi:hypothetical protein